MIPSPLLVVTDRHGSQRPLTETVRALLDGGARWIWFRDKDLEPEARLAMAREVLALVRDAGGWLTIGGDVELAAEIGADGVHLGGADFADRDAVRSARRRLTAGALVGLSAHSLADVRTAAEAGADYVTLSPIFDTASKPGYGPALGIDTLRAGSVSGIPIIALGGIDLTNASGCIGCGASGVAVMGGLMRVAEPGAQARRLLDALG